MYYLGIDLGTTSVSAAVIDAWTYYVVATKAVRHYAELTPDVPRAYLQDPELLVDQAIKLIQSYRERYGTFVGIGVTGQMHGIVYVNPKGKSLSPLYTWLDKRAENPIDKGISYRQLLYDLTGETVPGGYGASTHFALVRSERVPEETATLCTLADYFVMRLCGLSQPVTDMTLAQSMGLYDLEAQTFSEEHWGKIGGPNLKLPTVSRGYKVEGQYNGSAVITAIGDNQASFIGSVREFDSSVSVTLGTSGQLSCLSQEEMSGSFSDVDLRPFPGGGTLLVGASLTGGKAFQLLASLFAGVALEMTGEHLLNPYEHLDIDPRKLERPHLVVDTRFAGSRSEPQKTGSINNITLDNFSLEHLVYGFAQGVVDELDAFWQGGFSDAGVVPKIRRMAGSGNLLRSNRLIRQLLTETFTLPLMVTDYQEEAAVGAAIHAMAVTRGEPLAAVARKVVRRL